MPSSPGTSTLPQNFIPWTPHEIWLYTKINLQLQLYWSRGPPHLFRQEIHSEPKNLGVETPYFGPQLFLKIWICKAESYPFWLYILPGMFLRVRNPEIMVRKSENEGKHLFWDHFCVVVAMVCLGQKFTVWKKKTAMLCRKYLLEFWNDIEWNLSIRCLGICGIQMIFFLEIGNFSQNLAVKMRKTWDVQFILWWFLWAQKQFSH